MSKAKLERLLNLTALLMETQRPLTAQGIHERLEGYPSDPTVFRQTFERDKRELREMGIPLTMEPIPHTKPAMEGYRIPKDRYYLADPGLAPDELAALHLAASLVRLDGVDGAVDDGLLKLGAVARSGDEQVVLPGRSDLGAVFGAVAERRPVRFVYRDEKRTIDPYRLDFQRGRWYLTGRDHDREADRVFRLDRIVGEVEVLDGPSFERPDRDVAGGPVDSWQLGEGEPIVATLAVDCEQAPWIEAHLGVDSVVERHDDGSVVVELAVTDPANFRSFALSFLEHAEVLGPPELRKDIVAWLESCSSSAARGPM